MTLAEQQQHYRQRIDGYLGALIDGLPALAPNLKAAMKHGLLLGGKRVRPFLVYSTGTMLGLDEPRLDPMAAAVECIHAYSLIHDDLPAMDDDKLRRGQPTVHVAFDEATAILAGDALQALAFEELAKCQVTSIEAFKALLVLFSQAAGYQGMVAGQAMDMAATGQTLSLAALEQVHAHKTGALIRASVLMPALTAGISPTAFQALATFAEKLGLAFQVQDDILDVTANTETLGKTQGKDQRDHKATYPALLGLNQAQTKAQTLVDEALSCLASLPYNSEHLAALARYVITRER
ncbi:MAG: (2E,6E)-farnesyl diphosphate synthase [Pseudomonadota bacterium]|uniref:(2E,6E)-farnesyl diphosphate synthase n=1 Tax=Gallaecimonas pentaromativorans TaxID=584787 RepID=UPI00067F4E22|nr:(2E,6E)-farnesyl diphosphate synthase [Gallaecimonas pentaromativorans]MED5525036.1 (2E,6E)-farnesyl diphosphate synthase [Pseudomonadota bacterium]